MFDAVPVTRSRRRAGRPCNGRVRALAQFERRVVVRAVSQSIGSIQFTIEPRATAMMTEQTMSVPSQAPLTDGQSEAEQIKMQVLGSRFMFLPALAGISYGIAWAGGLAAWPSNLTIDATKREIVSLYSAHQSEATAQYLVVEAIAGVLLGMVLLYCIWSIRRCERTWTSRAAVAGGVAVAVSLLQCLLGLLLVSAASKGHLSQSGDICQLINRLDGVKQLLLGACVVMLGILLRTTSNYPLWLWRTSVITGIALVPSGLGYLLLWNVLARTAFVSLPLLILWVAGTGIWFGAESQRPGLRVCAFRESLATRKQGRLSSLIMSIRNKVGS
jgi:hypothetical protein